MSETKVDFDKIFNNSVKLTVPYVIGYACGAKYGQPTGWIDIITDSTIFFGACYSIGMTGSLIYNKIKSMKDKRIEQYQNNQNGR